MLSTVYFLKLDEREDPSSIAKKSKIFLKYLKNKLPFRSGDFVGVKTHFGEKDNKTYIRPQIVKELINILKTIPVKPFLVETSTLYRGSRSNGIDHLITAFQHGFGWEKIGVPIVMVDGIFGDMEVSITVDGKHSKEVNIAADVAKLDGLFVISHFKGHIQAGFGGIIKNLGMGLSSRKGKLKQHSLMTPEISREKCTGCWMCIRWCPKDTIRKADGYAVIDKAGCIGCGECLAVCKFGAVRFDWGREGEALMEMMAEHSAGVIKAVNGRVFYITYLMNISKDCDCMGGRPTIISRDIGVLAGDDPVAVEKASYDMFKTINNQGIEQFVNPRIDPLIQVYHAEKLGLGTTDYNIQEVELEEITRIR
mgnify:FL=1